jgi:hypothetical protein
MLPLLVVATFAFVATRCHPAEAAAKSKKAKPSKTENVQSADKGDKAVYFTPNGKRYHVSDKCTFLARSKKIEQGMKAELEKRGLTSCRSCAGEEKPDSSENSASGTASPPNGDVFFTPNSKRYHATDKCTLLVRSKSITKGNRADLEKRGLTPCKTCAGKKSNGKEATKM